MSSKFIFLLLIGNFYIKNVSAHGYKFQPSSNTPHKWLAFLRYIAGEKCPDFFQDSDLEKNCLVRYINFVENNEINLENVLDYLTAVYHLDKVDRRHISEDLYECRDKHMKNKNLENQVVSLFQCITVIAMATRLELDRFLMYGEMRGSTRKV